MAPDTHVADAKVVGSWDRRLFQASKGKEEESKGAEKSAVLRYMLGNLAPEGLASGAGQLCGCSGWFVV